VSFVHEDGEFGQLLDIVARETGIAAALIEKDYWVTHTLWALHGTGLDIWFKGGTSLSKGFALIQRFSEDLDLMIQHGSVAGLPEVTHWTSTNKGPVAKRRAFYGALASAFVVPGVRVEQDPSRIDKQARAADYLGHYPGVLLDQLTPAQMIMASSWDQHAEESAIDQGKAYVLFPSAEKPPRECLAGDGDDGPIFEPDAGADSHLRTDAFAIAEVILEERSRLSCDVASNGMFCKLREGAREMHGLGEPKQAQYVEPVLVLQAIWSVLALGDLVQLGDHQRCNASNAHIECPRVGGIERSHTDERMIDHRRFEAGGLARELGSVNTKSGAASTRTTERCRHHKIDLDFGHAPRARADGELEASGLERAFELGFVVELSRIDREVTVGGVGGDRQVAFAHVQVDGLRADQHHRLPVRAESFVRIEQHAPRGNVFRLGGFGARHPRFLSSFRSVLRLLAVLARDSSSDPPQPDSAPPRSR
jgi:hypothetical protein